MKRIVFDIKAANVVQMNMLSVVAVADLARVAYLALDKAISTIDESVAAGDPLSARGQTALENLVGARNLLADVVKPKPMVGPFTMGNA